MVANVQFGSRNRHCRRTPLCHGMTTNIGGTTRHRIIGDQRNSISYWNVCLSFIVFVILPALCATELVERENDDDGLGAIWLDDSFNLDPNGANVCSRTSLKLVTSLLNSDEVTTICDSIYSPATCHALRSGSIGTDELYLPLVNTTCCDGFLQEGNACPTVCPVNTFGQDCLLSCSCQNGGSCNPKNGTCQCRPGWTGIHCEHTCPPNRYGDRCEGVCDCENGGSCNRSTGLCLCLSGFTGARCTSNCTPGSTALGCSDDYHCERCENVQQAYCDPTFGSCICADGWQGRFCAHTCLGLTHGSFCNDQCDCVNADYCWPVDGQCECRPGWTGERCNQECPDGSFGKQCHRLCSCPEGGVCDNEHGGCDCPAGWKGHVCASPCMDDEWGAGCTQACNCSDDQDCEPVRGRCYNPDDYQDGSPNQPSNSNTITIIAAIAGVVVVVIVITMVLIIRCRKKRTSSRQTPGRSVLNGVQNGSAGTDQTERYSGPSPPPRDPSTPLPLRDASERGFRGYESIPGTHRSNSYLEIYEDSSQINNPLYEPGSSGYEVPTLERGIDSQENPGQSQSRNALNPLYGENAGYEVPSPNGTLERGIDIQENSGQSRGRVAANPLYGRSTGYEEPTPRGTLERAVEGSTDDGGYTYLTAPPRAENNYTDLTM